MDYVKLWDDYSIQIDEILEAGFGGDGISWIRRKER